MSSPPGTRSCWHYISSPHPELCYPSHDYLAKGPLLAHGFCSDQCCLIWCADQVWYWDRWRSEFGIKVGTLQDALDELKRNTFQAFRTRDNWDADVENKLKKLDNVLDRLCDHIGIKQVEMKEDLAKMHWEVSRLKIQAHYLQSHHDSVLQLCKTLLDETIKSHVLIARTKKYMFWCGIAMASYTLLRKLRS